MKKTLILISLSLVGFTAFSQCKGFTKRKCLPGLSPYLSNGQMNSAQLTPGEDASVQLNLNKGLSYRIMVCADPYLENLEYKLLTSDDQEITTDTVKNFFTTNDIEVDESQPIKLALNIPIKNNTTGIERSGCVTILLGFKE